MKSTIWNILAVLILLAILLVWVVVFQIFLDPQTSLNLLPPPTNVPHTGPADFYPNLPPASPYLDSGCDRGGSDTAGY